MDHPCQHCLVDPHSPNIWPPKMAVVQLRGVWLCQYHYDNAVLVGPNGYLLGPETAREYKYDMERHEQEICSR